MIGDTQTLDQRVLAQIKLQWLFRTWPGRASGTISLQLQFGRSVRRWETAFMLMVETELRPSPVHGIGTFLLRGCEVRRSHLALRQPDRPHLFRCRARNHAGTSCRISSRCTRHSTRNRVCGCCAATTGGTSITPTSQTRSRLGRRSAMILRRAILAAGTELTTDYFAICDAVGKRGTIYRSRPCHSGPAERLPPSARQEAAGSRGATS